MRNNMVPLQVGNIIQVIPEFTNTSIDTWIRENKLTSLSYDCVDSLHQVIMNEKKFDQIVPFRLIMVSKKDNTVEIWSTPVETVEYLDIENVPIASDEFMAAITAYRLLYTKVSTRFNIPEEVLKYTFNNFLTSIWQHRLMTNVVATAFIPFLQLYNQNTIIIIAHEWGDTPKVEHVICTTI